MDPEEQQTSLLLPAAFKGLHFLKLDLKSESSKVFRYNLKNHFNSTVAQVKGRVVVVEGADKKTKAAGDGEDDNSYVEIVAVEQVKKESGSSRSKLRSFRGTKVKGQTLFRLALRKTEDEGEVFDEDGNPHVISLDCELFSNKENSLGHIFVVKDIRSSTYSYRFNEERRDSIFKFVKEEKGPRSPDNCAIFIHYIAADDSGSESRLIGRIEMGDKNDNSVSLCMTPELDQLTKLRLISTMILMEMVENRQKEKDEAKTDKAN